MNRTHDDKPLHGVQYRLTGGTGTPCVANGNTWAESRVDRIENDEQQRNLEQLGAEALENVDAETRHNIERVAARMVNNKKHKEAQA